MGDYDQDNRVCHEVMIWFRDCCGRKKTAGVCPVCRFRPSNHWQMRRLGAAAGVVALSQEQSPKWAKARPALSSWRWQASARRVESSWRGRSGDRFSTAPRRNNDR